ncbi:MAG: hypothetical protein JWP07_3840 [Pseudonocardiales bacterium]|nr:hypothetical protein [Pseudonocardiales bacterium]
MTDTDSVARETLTTEQIAAAGTVPDAVMTSEPAQTSADEARPAGGEEPHAQLLEANEVSEMVVRWRAIQTNFVDQPRQAVQDADALVADLMQRLAQMFATERGRLESQWAGGGDVSTEDLRQGLQRYRSFFERLLAV